MSARCIILTLVILATSVSSADARRHGRRKAEESDAFGQMTLRADRIVVNNITKAAVATGHVHATCGVVTIRGESMSRDADGIARFDRSTYVTTCTNELGHTHWNVTGAVEFQPNDHVLLKDCWLTLWEIPVFYLPYFWYPLNTDNGFSWMPGWTSDWGAYVMTKYAYHLLGDSDHGDESYWLRGDTRLDFREKQGLALGEGLDWRMGDFGAGHFKVYYAWDSGDQYAEDGLYDGDYNYSNWASSVPDNRYALELKHRWNPTERDIVRIQGAYFSDSVFRDDFFRDSLFSIANPFIGYNGNEVVWEHLERVWSAGVSVSGPMNDFWGGTARLPEFYFDVNPEPLFALPVNYESQTRVGYLARTAGETERSSQPLNPYAYNPGPWADYHTFRLDTYHRLTAPFRSFGDVLSVVPRLAYRGTYWNQCGGTDLTGFDIGDIGESGGQMYRSIPEAGVTFSARGTARVNENWRHTIEPYLDVLIQEACLSGASGARRPYVFDNLDASIIWEDQFAGRARNLPYSYYGITPGLRQAWEKYTEDGRAMTVLDLDVFAALQFNLAEWYEAGGLAGYDMDRHRLAAAGSPNYGETGCTVVPGARVRWNPDETISLAGAVEYDTEDSRIALADVSFRHTVSTVFSYYTRYNLRDYRWWDYSSTPYRNERNRLARDRVHMENDDFNLVYFHLADVGFEHQPLDWFRWSPFLRWDIRDGACDSVGAWFDYLVDCIGFRFIFAYKNGYTTLDGYDHRERYNFGFVIYLRAMGDDGANIFNN